MEGWIKIHRKLLDWGWFTDPNTLSVFLFLLLKANIKDGEFLGHTIRRGECAASLPTISKGTGLTIQNVRTALKHLESTGEVTCTGYPKFSVFTVSNYDRYQLTNTEPNIELTGNQQATNIELTGNQQATNRQLTTIEEEKEIKEGKKEKKNKKERNITGVPTIDEAFRDYADMRKRIGKPLTDKAITLAIGKLHELAPDGDGLNEALAVKILEQSTFNSWQGLFPLKDQQKKPDYFREDGTVDLLKKWGVNKAE